MQMQEDSEFLFNICLSVNDLNSLLEATISERIRVLARGVNSRKAYCLKGKEQEDSMLSYLKVKL